MSWLRTNWLALGPSYYLRKANVVIGPETTVRLNEIEFGDPWDFGRVYETLFKFARSYPFDTDAEDYLIHITTGTHVAQICLFLLTEARYLAGRLLQVSPQRDRGAPGEIKIIDLDLSKYDRIASRFRQEQSSAALASNGPSSRICGSGRIAYLNT